MKLSTLVACLLSLALPAQAQSPDNWERVHEKTLAQLEEIVEGSAGITGLAVIDLNSDRHFGFNQDMVFPQGSAIKVPILMEVFRQAHQGEFDLDDLRTVEKADQVGGSGLLGNLTGSNARLSIRDLATLMILISDNTATNMLIDLVGMESVNTLLEELGLDQTRLQRKMMDVEARVRGDENLSTPAEAARIMQILHNREFVSREVSDDILAVLRIPKDSGLAEAVADDVAIAMKAGGIPGVSTEWVVVEYEHRPYVAVFMQNFGVGGRARQDMEAISKLLWDYFRRLGASSRFGTYVR